MRETSLTLKRKLEGNKAEVETATRDGDGADESRITNKKAARSAEPDNGHDSLSDDGVLYVKCGSSENEMTVEHKTPCISPEVSKDESEVAPMAPMKIVVRIRSLAGNIIKDVTYTINRNMAVDVEPSLRSIQAHAAIHFNEEEVVDWAILEKIHVYIKTPERDGKTQTVKCGDRPFDKIRFYVTEKDLIDDGKATASHEAEVMPLYRIEVTAVIEA